MLCHLQFKLVYQSTLQQKSFHIRLTWLTYVYTYSEEIFARLCAYLSALNSLSIISCVFLTISISSQVTQIHDASQHVQENVGSIYLIVNCVFYNPVKAVDTLRTSHITRSVTINLESVIWVVRAFLPEMKEKKTGHIVTVSSTASLYGQALNTLHSSTSAALEAFSRGLRAELQVFAKEGVNGSNAFHDIHVSSVICAPIRSKGSIGITPTLWEPILDVNIAADAVIDAVEKNKAVVYVPRRANVAAVLNAILPTKLSDWLWGVLGMRDRVLHYTENRQAYIAQHNAQVQAQAEADAQAKTQTQVRAHTQTQTHGNGESPLVHSHLSTQSLGSGHNDRGYGSNGINGASLDASQTSLSLFPNLGEFQEGDPLPERYTPAPTRANSPAKQESQDSKNRNDPKYLEAENIGDRGLVTTLPGMILDNSSKTAGGEKYQKNRERERNTQDSQASHADRIVSDFRTRPSTTNPYEFILDSEAAVAELANSALFAATSALNDQMNAHAPPNTSRFGNHKVPVLPSTKIPDEGSLNTSLVSVGETERKKVGSLKKDKNAKDDVKENTKEVD